MRWVRTVIVLMVCVAATLLLLACGQSIPGDSFVGTWRHDPQSAKLVIADSADGFVATGVFDSPHKVFMTVPMRRDGDTLTGDFSYAGGPATLTVRYDSGHLEERFDWGGDEGDWTTLHRLSDVTVVPSASP